MVTSTPDVPEWKLYVDRSGAAPLVWVMGSDPRGALFGAGYLLRQLNWRKGVLQLPDELDVSTSPALALRGHQIGFRTTAEARDEPSYQ